MADTQTLPEQGRRIRKGIQVSGQKTTYDGGILYEVQASINDLRIMLERSLGNHQRIVDSHDAHVRENMDSFKRVWDEFERRRSGTSTWVTHIVLILAGGVFVTLIQAAARILVPAH